MTGENGETIGDLGAAVAELEAGAAYPSAYITRVRAAVRRLDPLPPFPLDVPQALALVNQQSRVDVDVPLRTRRRGAKAAKIAIKRLTAFYVSYLANQVGDLGQALVHLGTALADRVEGVEEQLGSLSRSTDASVADLARRVADLEKRQQSVDSPAPEQDDPPAGA
ncbi:MAG TPA: hypothetical protein VHA57_08570 [Actinomycetota bacterium]|nr:hypothetical protein [Actinomycetota bacterium]